MPCPAVARQLAVVQGRDWDIMACPALQAPSGTLQASARRSAISSSTAHVQTTLSELLNPIQPSDTWLLSQQTVAQAIKSRNRTIVLQMRFDRASELFLARCLSAIGTKGPAGLRAESLYYVRISSAAGRAVLAVYTVDVTQDRASAAFGPLP